MSVRSFCSSIYSPSTRTSTLPTISQRFFNISCKCGAKLLPGNNPSSENGLHCSKMYPVYNQIILSGNLLLISLTRDRTSSRFCSAKHSPPRNETRLIYGLSISFINFSLISSVHSLPPLKSHVSELKQFLQWNGHP